MALSTELDLDASVDRDRFMELTTASNRWINQLERSTSAFQARCKAEKEAEEEEAVQAAVAAKKAADEAREAKKAANGKATSRTRSMTTKATGPAGVESVDSEPLNNVLCLSSVGVIGVVPVR
ncbi:MAG: hypothetical protein Q9201_002229 [Fulgogasparrea decipioides]